MSRARATLATLALALLAAPAANAAPGGYEAARLRLRADDPAARVVAQGAPRRATFVSARVAVATPARARATAARVLAVRALTRYRALFGLRSVRSELAYVATTTDASGARHVRFAQTAGGRPVLDARITVHLGAGGALRAVSAGLAPSPRLGARTATVSAARAERVARARMGAAQRLARPRLVAYAGALADRSTARLAWTVDLLRRDGAAHALFVVDTRTGRILDALDRMADARVRRTYTARHTQRLPGTFVLGETSPASGDRDVDAAHAYAGTVYDYYARTFGRDSYDGNGATIVSTAHYGRSYRNAFWNGRQMVYGDGFAVNDVVGHELTHAVTERTAGLVYQDQPGALNESLSDMAAWDVDPGDTTIGEDLPIGAIRDMRSPGRFGQPATTGAYVCTSQDSGGVHTNSGIPNRVYANLVDALGRSGAQQVRYRAQTTYLVPSSSFASARAAFVQAAADLGLDAGATGRAWDAQGVTSSWQPPC
jgi:Zn-dependent metalloprotease